MAGAQNTAVFPALALGLAAALGGERAVAADDAGFERLGPPEPGEWRCVFKEPAQSMEDYLGQARGLRPARIVLMPFRGEARTLPAETLSLLKEFLEAYFAVEVELGAGRSLPEGVRRRASRGFGRQVLAGDVLRAMEGISRERERRGAPARPVSAPALGIVQTDLYGTSPAGGYLNFVFGMGAYGRGVAVVSPARYGVRYEGEPEGITVRKRFFKVAAHELGHVFGVAHCQVYECCMNGSNSLPESDGRPIHLCPECLLKLQWCLGFGHDRRYGALEAVYRRLGWERDAALAARRAALAAAEPAHGPPDDASREKLKREAAGEEEIPR